MATPAPSLTPNQDYAALQRLLQGPAGPPPAGVVSNFDDPPNHHNILYVTVALTLGFATCAISIRIYTKLFLLRSVGYEDYASVIAWISFVGFAGPFLLFQKSGSGTHMWDIRLEAFFRVLYWVYISAIIYAITVTFVKLSILLQYLKIFVPSRKGGLPLFIAIHACIWSLVTFYLVDTFFFIFMCTPRKKVWNPLMTTGHCFDAIASWKASGVFNVLSDFAILILPMPTVWNLQMPLKRRLLIMGVFATGFFACVASILRSYYSWRTVESLDTSWELLPMGLWAWAELSIGIIVVCLPVFPKFFNHVGTKVHRGTSGSGPARESSAAAKSPKVDILSRVKRPFASVSDSWNGQYSPRAQVHDEYVSLDGFDTPPPHVKALDTPTGWPGQGIATVREDLENAQQRN